MVHLERQYFFALFRPPAFGDVLKAIDRAYDVSIAILDCFDVNERDAARTVRPFDVDFLLAHGNSAPQHLGHGAFMGWERTAIGAVHSIRSAKSFIGIAEFRRPAP